MTAPQAPQRGRDLREWTSLAVLLSGAILAIYTFVYRDVLKPAARPTALDVTVTLAHVGHTTTQDLIQLRLLARNPTDRRVYIPALWYVVYGEKLTPTDTARFATTASQAPLQSITARGTDLSLVEVAATGRILSGGSWYDPLDKTADEYLFAIPASKYDFLEVRAWYIQVKDTVGLSTTRWTQLPDGQWTAELQLRGSSPDSLEVFAPKTNSRHAQWERRSGASENWAIATLPLWPAPK